MMAIDIEGADPFPRLATTLRTTAATLVLRAATEIAARARDRLPPDGDLANSIGVEETGADVVVRAAAPHAAYVEFGTSRMSARPYFGPAIADLGGRLLEVLS